MVLRERIELSASVTIATLTSGNDSLYPCFVSEHGEFDDEVD